jgi:phosphoribosylanthranilate isomerase
MTNAKIKICGITNLKDGQLSVDLGADYLGFNFYPPSPRYIEPQAAAEIIEALSERKMHVGVFVNEDPERVIEIARLCDLDYVQLHGDETPEYCKELEQAGVWVIKALRIKHKEDMAAIKTYSQGTMLLDAFHEKLYGGSGESFDWSWLTGDHGKMIFLAGGIKPDNIEAALQVGTYGIDLCSGVEASPGTKDETKLRAIFALRDG